MSSETAFVLKSRYLSMHLPSLTVLTLTRGELYRETLAEGASAEEKNGLNSVQIIGKGPSAPVFDGRPMRTRWGSSGPIGPHRIADPMVFCARWSPMRPDARFKRKLTYNLIARDSTVGLFGCKNIRVIGV